MQGSTRPPDSTPRMPRRSGLLFQMSRNGLLVRADNSDLSYKGILTRLVPGAPTYGVALEVLSGAPLAESRRVLLRAALLRALQEVVAARVALRTAQQTARPGGGACQAASYLRSALDAAESLAGVSCPRGRPSAKEAR